MCNAVLPAFILLHRIFITSQFLYKEIFRQHVNYMELPVDVLVFYVTTRLQWGSLDMTSRASTPQKTVDLFDVAGGSDQHGMGMNSVGGIRGR